MSQIKGRFLQNNFTNGIITPLLDQRYDYEKQRNSVRNLENFYILPHGGISFRRGTKKIHNTKPLDLGAEWKLLDHNVPGIHRAMAYSPLLNTLVIMPQKSDGTNTVIYTKDFKTWNVTTIQRGVWEKVIWISELKRFVAVASSVDIANREKRVAVSLDGVDWVTFTSSDKELRSIAWSPTLGKMVAVAYNASPDFISSPDGVHWSGTNNVPANGYTDIIWCEFMSKFVVISETGINRSLYSADGIDWTEKNTVIDKAFTSLAVSNENDRIIAVASDSEMVMRGSKDVNGNLVWSDTTDTGLSQRWKSAVYVPEQDKFVCVSEDGGSYRSVFSTDGTASAWKKYNGDSTTSVWQDLIWIPERNKLLASSTTKLMEFDFGDITKKKTRMIPFIFSQTDALMIELGNKYARLYKNDAIVTTTKRAISDINISASPVVVSYTGSSAFTNGDRIILRNIAGTTGLNNREYQISNHTAIADGFSFELLDSINTGLSAYVSDGYIEKILEFATPFADDKLNEVKYTQSADVMYFFHSNYPTFKVSRVSDTTWITSSMTAKPPPTEEKDTDLSVTISIDSITHVGAVATVTISAGHSYWEGAYITIAGAYDPLYNGTFQINTVTSTTFKYTMSGTPDLDAQGTLVASATTLKPAATGGTNILFQSGSAVFQNADRGRQIKYGLSRATIKELLPPGVPSMVKTISTITHSGKTATVTSSSHGYSNGDRITVHGVDQEEYNGTFKISGVTASTFNYTMDKNPGVNASGTLMLCYKSDYSLDVVSITRTDDEATCTTSSAHGYQNGFSVTIKGANQSEYNGTFFIFDVTSTTFKYTVSGTPATPATGTIFVKLDSPTNVVACDIDIDFSSTSIIPAGDWYLTASPKATLTFSAKGHTDESVKVTSDLKTFRSTDVGKYIRFLRSDTGTYATFQITKVINPKEIRALTILRIHKDDSKTIDSENWTLETSDWSIIYGFPSSGVFFQDRLWVVRDSTVWASMTGDYENFNLGDMDDSAIKTTFLSREINKAIWITVDREQLICGTNGGEWLISSGNTDTTITPTNINLNKTTNYGSISTCDPVIIQNGVLFVQQSGTKLRRLAYDFASDGYMAEDLTIHAEHLFKYQITKVAFQMEPIPIVWVITSQGELFGLTMLAEQQVSGWGRFNFSFGFVEDIAIIPSGKYPKTYLTVLRDVNGKLTRFVEILEPPFLVDQTESLDDRKEMFVEALGSDTYKYGYKYDFNPITEYSNTKGKIGNFFDCSIIYDGDSTSTVGGLGHLEGCRVNALIDGTTLDENLLVSGGTVTTSVPGSVILVGLPYRGLVELIPPQASLDNGFSLGLVKRLLSMVVNIYASSNFKYGTDLNNMLDARFITYDSTEYKLWSGDSIDEAINCDYRRIPNIYLQQQKSYPLNILSVVTEAEILNH